MKLTLGEKLKDERVKRKLTSKQVCDEIKKRYNYNLSIGKYNEIESDVSKDFGYKAFIYLSKFFEVSTDYLLGLSENPSTDPDIINACLVTGLNLDSVNNLLKKPDEFMEIFNDFICSNEFYDFLRYLHIISELQQKKEAFNFINNKILLNIDLEDTQTIESKYFCAECNNFFSTYTNNEFFSEDKFPNESYDMAIRLIHSQIDDLISEYIKIGISKKPDNKKIVLSFIEFLENELEIIDKISQKSESLDSIKIKIAKMIEQLKEREQNGEYNPTKK